jgi:signal transduction histidine kinase
LGVTFPARLLADHNVLSIRLRGDAGRRAGISPVVIGPSRLVEPLRARTHALRVLLPWAAAMFSLLVSGFCLLLWLQQRESLYAWASLSELLWAIVVADVVMEWAPLRWPGWMAALLVLRAIWIWALYAIVEQVFGRRPPLARAAMKTGIAVLPLCLALAFFMGNPLPVGIWRITVSVLWTILAVKLLLALRTQASTARVLLTVAIVGMLVGGLHDAAASNLFSARFDDSVWAKYVGALLGLTIMWVVSKRFYMARMEALELQQSLERRIEQKEQDLRESFERLSQADRARAVSAERERILRDMHDGVGANLATAMRQLEGGTAPAREVAATLRESLDHLKLSIDAMNLPTGDVNALLASLRYRLQPRIASAGLTVEWEVDSLPHWAAGSDQAMRHLQFLLLEAISNVLQHAEATTLTLRAQGTPDTIEIVVTDNGRGLGEASGRELQSMRERAKAIGAQFSADAAQPGTRVRVELPVSHVKTDQA